MDGQWLAAAAPPHRAPSRDPWWWFLAATVLASLGLALAYGALTPRGFAADEPAHTAYADELRHGHLPDIDTIQPTSPYAAGPAQRGDSAGGTVESDGTASTGGQATVAPPSGPPRSEDYIYVANHPPLFAAVQAAITAGLEGAGLADDATLGVGRVLNALLTIGAIVVLALLGREVAGNLRTGVLAAASFAAIPALWSLATFGYSDGAAVLATTVVVWAAVVAWNVGTTRSMGLLGLAVAAAGATRATALVVAAFVGVVVLVHQALRHRARESHPVRWRARVRRDVRLVVLPPLLLSAWWYVRTWIRFGDPTGSAVLNGRLHRQSRPGGILAQLFDLDLWQRMITQLTASAYTPTPLSPQVRLAPWAVWATGLMAVAGLAGLFRRPVDADHGPLRLPERAGQHAGPATTSHAGQISTGPTSASRAGPARGVPDPIVWAPSSGVSSVSGTSPGAAQASTTAAGGPWLRGAPVLVAAVFGVLFGVAGHVSDGGAPHGRYLLLAMPILCLALVIGLERLDRRLPLVAVGAAATASLWMLQASTHWVDDLRHRLGGDRFGAAWLSDAGVAVALVGLGLAVASAVGASRQPGNGPP